MALSDYLVPERVLFLSQKKRKDVLSSMIDRADELGLVGNRRAFAAAIAERESIISTGIGLGVAVPHAKLPIVRDFFVIVAVLDSEVDWDAIDRKGVRLVFLIGGPDNRQTAYLQILAKIVLVTKNDELRKVLLDAKTPEEAVAPFAAL